ncbi:MAG: hypothetical protein K2V38_10065, partial [Gemmataceae bacterium]|nr:hypothetical protein [Gemmataceae bacterium]
FAYPDGPDVRLRAIAEGVKIRAKLPAPKPVPKKTAAKKKPVAKALAAKATAAPAPVPGYRAVAFNPAGTLLATAGDDKLVTFHDTTTWKPVRSFAWKIGKLRAVCFSADGTRAATWGEKGGMVVWDVDV